MKPIGTMPGYRQEVLRKQKCPVQVRWDFKEEQQELEDGEIEIVWTFSYETLVAKWDKHKVYAKDEICWGGKGEVYLSEIDNNTLKPGSSGWKKIEFNGFPENEEDKIKGWEQAVYRLGEVVVFDNKKYISNHPENDKQPEDKKWVKL